MCRAEKMSCQTDTTAASSFQEEECHCKACTSCGRTASSEVSEKRRKVVHEGDIVTIDLQLTPENGLIPEPLFDRNGVITFVVGLGNYLPGLHELVQGKGIGETVQNVSIDAGFGGRKEELVMELPTSKLRHFQDENGNLPAAGSILELQGGIELTIVEIHEDRDTVIVDANPPLAGASYACTFEILNIEDMPAEAALKNPVCEGIDKKRISSRYEVSTWALGCFWGGELAFMRVPGVVGTRVGYTQGIVSNPTYEAVCTGKTQHREAIMVISDPDVVTYRELLQVALERLAATKVPNSSSSNLFVDMFSEDTDERNNKQYRHGFYYHTEEQHKIAQEELHNSNPYDIELKRAAAFYDAEEYHQNYLYKGGQTACKGAKQPIRCYG